MPKSVILVTGASSGFGLMTARALARAGHTVYASMLETAGRNAPQVADAASWAAEHGADLRTVELDVLSDASAEAAVGHVLANGGRLDVIVHNAGHMVHGPAEAFTPDQLAEQYDVNVLGTQRVNRAALPHMRSQGWGLLVWVGSSYAVALREAVVRDHERGAGHQSPVHFDQGVPALLLRDEMQGQEASRPVERPRGRAVDVALMKVDARGERAERVLGQLQHFRRGINAAEAPSRLRVGQGFQLQPTTCAEDEHMGIVSDPLSEETDHPLQTEKARYLPHGTFGITRHGLRVRET